MIPFYSLFPSCGSVIRFSLVHGDAHPHNALWVSKDTEEERLVMIDFEMVGVGSPAQELGQYMISHMEPDARRACEDQVVRAYHEELLRMVKPTAQEKGKDGNETTVEAYTFEACWAEYIAGGIGRWVWFIPLFRGFVTFNVSSTLLSWKRGLHVCLFVCLFIFVIASSNPKHLTGNQRWGSFSTIS